MKKGLLLTLLMIAMVALVVPAGARAPIVNDLPDVIIGDGDPGEQATDPDLGAIRLMRYLNVVSLDGDWVETRNGLGHTNLNIYYADIAGDGVEPNNFYPVKASNATAIIEPLTSIEVANIEGGIPVSSSRALNGGGFGWLSLINAAINDAATTPAANAYSATAAGNGVAPASYPLDDGITTMASTSWDDPVELTVYAVELAFDGVSTVALMAKNTFNVDSVSDSIDQLGSTSTLASVTNLANNAAGWNNTPPGADPSYDRTTGVATANGLSFTAAAGNSLPVYGQWQSGSGGNALPIIDADEATVGADQIIHLQATIGSNAATAAICPGWRLLFASQMFTHLGGVSATTYANDAAGIHAPSVAGGDLDVELYWAVPYELTQYADGELLSDFSGVSVGFTDVRAYLVLWNMLDWEDADAGAIWLSDLTATAVARPFGAAPFVSWGAGGTYAFDDDSGRRWYPGGGAPTGFGIGVFDYSATSIEIGANDQEPGYMSASPNPLALGVYTGWNADDLIRIKSTWSSLSSIDSCPTFRILILVYSTTTSSFRSLMWGESYTGGLAKLQMALNDATDQTLPAVPKGVGSDLETYIYTHNGGGTGTGALNSRLYPGVDCYAGAQIAGWPSETGRLRVSSVSVETGL